MEDKEDIILHIIVVGFHHKKGYQVEFTYPQWPTGDECPAEWSHLPSIAMPDGSHNYHQETVYFHLPPIEGSDTVYGVSCYRQIDSDRVVNRTEDITRKSVQKSVIALSKLPLYGQIQVKLELITSAYFETGDFSRVEVLREAYTNLNRCLSPDMLHSQQVFVGLSVRDLVLMFRHKLLVLFKLILLERRVLVQHSPVSELCSAVLALTSLLPEMVQRGLQRAVLQPPPPSRRTSAAQSPSQPAAAASTAAAAATAVSLAAATALSDVSATSGTPAASAASANTAAEPSSAGGGARRRHSGDLVAGNSTFYCDGDDTPTTATVTGGSGGSGTFHRSNSDGAAAVAAATETTSASATARVKTTTPMATLASRRQTLPCSSVFYDTPEAEAAARASTFYLDPSGEVETGAEAVEEQQQEQQSVDAKLERLLAAAHQLDDVRCGMPLRRFRKGHLCHPYLCLSDIHLLTDGEVLTFLAGATNVLYSHKRHLVDAYVTMSPCSVELSASLRRQLALSTEDLRLADLLVRAVTEPGPGSGSGSGSPAAGGGQQAPRGSDAWLRAVFRLYMYMLLRTSLLPDGSAEHALYNSCYIAALKETPSYVQWADGNHLGILEVNPGHPCSGQLSMADMRLRISQTFQSSERGRKVTQVAAMTGRAVGGALTVARGALSSWWSSLATPEEATPPAEPALDAASAGEEGAQTAAPAPAPAAAAEQRPGRPVFEAASPADGQTREAAPCL